jgi:hypothetical protein
MTRSQKRILGSVIARGVFRVQSCLPRNRFGDRVYSWLGHVLAHGRLPRRKGLLFNDRLYFVKTSPEFYGTLRSFVADKEYVKTYVKRKIGDKYNVATVMILRSFADAATYTYPDRCVIKPTHSSGHVIMRLSGEPLDFSQIKHWFSLNLYDYTRAVDLKSLVPKVIVEPILFGDENLKDFKFFCVRGIPRLIQVDLDRRKEHRRSIYSTDWVKQPYALAYPQGRDIEKPSNLFEMLRVASVMSADFDFLRVDLYTDGSSVYVGELTNCPGNAQDTFVPSSGERAAGLMLFGTS